MPRIFDNISEKLYDALLQTLSISKRADSCVGYFKLSGWKYFSSVVEPWSGADDHCVRILVGMQKPPQEMVRDESVFGSADDLIDNNRAIRLKNRLAEKRDSGLNERFVHRFRAAGDKQFVCPGDGDASGPAENQQKESEPSPSS